jgi:Carboxypeptidase regulatory-like domain
VVSQESGFRRVTESDTGGAFRVGGLEPGAYKITVQKEGFKARQVFDVALKGAAATRVDFPLEIGSVHDTIVVHGTAPVLDRSDAATGAKFDAGEIARLPLNGGGLLNLIEMVPGANVVPATRGDAGQFSATGQRANTNIFTVDGVSANTGVAAGGLPAQAGGGTLPVVSAFGSLDPLISLNAIDEMQAQTSTTIAQFGRMPGANVGVTSHAGANQFHGETQYSSRNELLGANDWFANRAGIGVAPERLNDFTQTFGGPIQRDSTFFFLSYQNMGLREPFLDTQAVPDSFARAAAGPWAQVAVNLFPLPNQGYLAPGIGQWTGGSDEPASLQAGSARIDRALGSRANFFGRYGDSPSMNNFGNVAIGHLDLRSQTLTLGLTVRPFSRLTLDARVNESQTSAESSWGVPAAGAQAACALQPLIAGVNRPGPCDTVVRFTIDGSGQLISGNEGLHRQRQFQTVNTAALRLGQHSLGFGIDYRRVSAIRRDAAGAVGVIADSANDLSDTRNLWEYTNPQVTDNAELTEYSLWAQDTWRVSSALTIAMGLRWEFSPSPSTTSPVYIYDPAAGNLNSTSGQIWPTSYRNLAPRIGGAYRLTKDGRTVLRAGAGLYYDSSVSIATDVLDGGPLNSSQLISGIHAPFSVNFIYGFVSGLKLPQVRQWNVSLDRALTSHDVVSLGYVGSNGRELIRREVGGPGSGPNSWLALTTNDGFSNYQALQFQYRRRFASGWQASAAYTWSHSIDNDSSDASLLWAGLGASPNFDFGSSDFDLRHAFNGSLSYQFTAGRLKGWRAESIVRARSGFPLTVLESEQYTGIAFTNFARPNYIGGPVWVSGASVPGGTQLNPAVFQVLRSGVQGDLGRNAIAGLGMWQVDAAIGREFRFRDRFRFDLRVEAFNALNHANFSDPVRYLDSPLFGQSTSMLNLMLGTGSPGSGLAPMLQSGGPRLLQGTLRFWF